MPQTDAFTRAVEDALELIGQPDTLGQRSPLAAPYFLGRYLPEGADAATPEGRANALIVLFRQAARTLSEDQQQVLSVAFFEADPRTNLNELRAGQLHRSLRTYYRDRTAAISALAAAFGRLVIPPLRAELPRVIPLIGRAGQLTQAAEILAAKKSLAITGLGGSGKTTLGAHIAANRTGGRHFWFTIRPGFTDNASALLFGLCHFLHGLGESSAWLQLVADAGKDKAPLEFSRIRPMLRHDLERLQLDPAPPLLVCIDDVDLLDPKRIEHDRVLDVIRELRDLAPLLLLSQNLVLETDNHLPLAGLGSGDIAAMLSAGDRPPFTGAEIDRLTAATQGLPALVRLFALLHEMGEPIESTLELIEGGMSTDVLFQRVWVRLSEAEREILMQVAVFDGHAPADAWSARRGEIDILTTHGVLTGSQSDGLAVASFARSAVLKRVPANERPTLHARAAEALERRGEYTAAARQYLAAGQPAQAIALWSEHRVEETERGHAESALALLRGIQPEALQNENQRRILFALRAELYRKMGGIADGLADLSSTTWPSSHPLTPLAETLRGDLLEFSGGVESALAAYETALRSLSTQPETREVDVHTKIGFIRLYRSRDLAQAAQAALQARFRSESFHGKVLEEQGDFAGASDRFRAAAGLLDQLENATPQRAMNEADLGRVAMARGDFREAISRIEAAIRLYEQIGDFARHANQHMNLSFALNAAGDHARALEAASARLPFVRERGDSYLVSALACNAAEACAGLGRLDEAERYIGLALQQEEAFHRHYILTAQAVVHTQRNNHALAAWHFEEAIRLAQECDDPFGEAPAWRGLAMSHAQQGAFTQARAAMEHATDLYRQMGMSTQASEWVQVAEAWPAG